MSKESILIVEDEEKIVRLLEIELEYEGYETGKALDGIEAFEMFLSQKWDLILLDIMLPGMSGIELLRRIRGKNSSVPIILLTAKDSIEDKVSGLDLGASDYITKPFRMEELLARIRAVLRMSQATPASSPLDEEWLQVSDLRLNDKTREVIRNDLNVSLTPKEYDLLLYLLKNQRQVLERGQILEAVWGYDYYGDTKIVDVYIRYLRKKIDTDFDASLIHTVRGVGYVLKEAT
ncbi:DNA-binding response regulator, OmpR family, contains REC and winged-helix (wHTH) domain [Psychrobacillus psychrotolerans]|uniref:DNA-binding response regulator, OmpR family, contains REC and winged-helix (WHTH) domain n=1 Tax=Psychrobacillus psychrotolerans TaxID=126156 RepID=A0A1I5XUP1_9BACI|nr:response regulator transcription factor [Psychrobacillus psychrotolerans]SFQ35675.1 DNA-binding response regulator, OmpR family, contains REC and winged-helix (wHTH) domain [Psychrobacillus psychrotolerans]